MLKHKLLIDLLMKKNMKKRNKKKLTMCWLEIEPEGKSNNLRGMNMLI